MIDRHTAEHYQWGDGCDGWHLVRTPSLSVIEERMPPGTQETRHYHRAATQFFYVLEGWLSIEVEGREHEVSAAQGVRVDAGQAHQVRNRSEADGVFLVISNPPGQGDRTPA